MKKSAKDFSADTVSKDIASRKKRKGGVLKNGAAQKMVVSDKVVGGSWESEAGNTTESDSVNIEKDFLIEETSVDYRESDLLERRNINQTLKGPKVVTKQSLGKSLGKINFLGNDDNGDVLSCGYLELPTPLRNLVNVPVCKSFALNIGLKKVTGKSSQEKLSAVRKLFLGINGFGGASTPSKFAGIIKATFTSESSLAQAFKKAGDAAISMLFSKVNVDQMIPLNFKGVMALPKPLTVEKIFLIIWVFAIIDFPSTAEKLMSKAKDCLTETST
ncbi:hypothetical protein G9A89_005487 [Geosiphon pyriformis]|nr:hypothetical protein G9A89_005487 [Geosiphon pyriformis]